MDLIFDKGTILLQNPPPRLDLSKISGLKWDPRVNSYRSPAYNLPTIQHYIAQNDIEISKTIWNFPPFPGQWKQVDLRPYQEAALCAWNLGSQRGIIVLPTGSGKTHVAIAAMARNPRRTLVLVPTRILLQQWHQQLIHFFSGQVGVYGDSSRELGPVTVATFESAYRHMCHFGNQFEQLIIDEVHHFGNGVRDEALEMSLAPFRLGLTATMPHDTNLIDRMSQLVGPPIYELTVSDLSGTYLSNFDLIKIQLDLTPAERNCYEIHIGVFNEVFSYFRKSFPEASWKDFACWASRTDQGRKSLQALHQARCIINFAVRKEEILASMLARHRHNKILIFTADTNTAYKISKKYLVMPITADIKRKEREEALLRFRSGQLNTLVSCRVLNEGLDVPDAEVAIIIGGMHGEREHIQRIGRLLRPKPGKRACIYELVCNDTVEVRQSQKRRKGLGSKNTFNLQPKEQSDPAAFFG